MKLPFRGSLPAEPYTCVVSADGATLFVSLWGGARVLMFDAHTLEPKGDIPVGEPARRQAVTNPLRTIYSIKRFMGRRHNEVASEEKIVPYKVVGGPQE